MVLASSSKQDHFQNSLLPHVTLDAELGSQVVTPQTWLPIVEQISGKIWHNRGFNDKSVKTSKIVHLNLLNKIGYGPIA